MSILLLDHVPLTVKMLKHVFIFHRFLANDCSKRKSQENNAHKVLQSNVTGLLNAFWFCNISTRFWSSSRLTGAMSNNLMLHLHLIIPGLWPTVLQLNSIIVHFKCVLKAADGRETRGLACTREQIIHETHIHPYLTLIPALRLLLSGRCSNLHATKWIADFPPTWGIHPTSLGTNICQICQS